MRYDCDQQRSSQRQTDFQTLKMRETMRLETSRQYKMERQRLLRMVSGMISVLVLLFLGVSSSRIDSMSMNVIEKMFEELPWLRLRMVTRIQSL